MQNSSDRGLAASPTSGLAAHSSPHHVDRSVTRWTARFGTLLAAVLVTAGCGGSGPTDPVDENCRMTARLNGQAFCAIFFDVQRSAGQVYVNGGATGERAIGFTFPDSGPGTYSIGPGSLVAAGVTIGNANFIAGQDMGSGTIVISTLTANRVAGTFQLTAVGATTAQVTEGVFDSGS